MLLKIKDEKEEINFNSSFDVKKSVLNKIDNIDMNSITELGISNDKEIIDFISKRLLISELINVQKKYEDERAKKRKHYCGLSNHEIEESIETEVEYYYRNRQNSKNGIFYSEKELKSKTHFHSLEKKGLVAKETTHYNETIFIYDKNLIEDYRNAWEICDKHINQKNVNMLALKLKRGICNTFINQYIVRYSVYCFLKKKEKASFKEISDYIEKELKYIIPEADDKEIKAYITMLFVLIKCYYKVEENDNMVIYEESENNEKEYLHLYEYYERYFVFISKYFIENNVLNLNNKDEYDNKLVFEYKNELDSLDYSIIIMLCRILVCNGVLEADETYSIIEKNVQLLTNLKEYIKSIYFEDGTFVQYDKQNKTISINSSDIININAKTINIKTLKY